MAGRAVLLLAAGVTLGGGLPAAAGMAAQAAPTLHRAVAAPAVNSSKTNSEFNGVSADSSTDAWAVGRYQHDPPSDVYGLLTLQWDGTAWSQTPSTSPVGSQLSSVSASATAGPLAPGEYLTSHHRVDTVILGWDGTEWSRQTTPSPAHEDDLNGVSVVSPTSAWAVGSAAAGGTSVITHTLILGWNGTAWSKA